MLGACSQLPVDAATARRSPVFAYEFTEPARYTIGDCPGAAHGTDLPYLLDGSYQGPNPPPLTNEQKALATELVGFWTGFARTGSPGPSWPPYGHGTVLSFSAAQTAPVNLAAEHHCAFWRSRH